MERTGRALVLTLLPHGENGAVVRFLDLQDGLVAGFVHGARSRKRRADLSPGNRVTLRLSRRAEAGLATATLEVEESRALLAFDAAMAATLEYLVHLPALLFAEADPCPRFASGLDDLLSIMARSDRQWPRALAQLEGCLLDELGLGLDLGRCAVTGTAEGLAYASPRTGRAVSRAAAEGQPWQSRLLPLPAFLVDGGTEGALDEALALTGHFLARHAFTHAPRLGALRARALALLPSAMHRPHP